MFSFHQKHVLIVSPDPWGTAKMSKHHFAVALVESGAEVTFLEPPGNKEDDDRMRSGVRVRNFFKPTPGLRLLPDALRLPQAKRDVRRLLSQVGPVDVVWSFDNSRLFDLDAFEHAQVRIHHCMDANMDFQLKRAVRSADLCMGVTEDIMVRMAEAHPTPGPPSMRMQLPHGYVEHVASEKAIPQTANKRVFYAGNLAIGYIHWEWLLKLIAAFPKVDFVFAGNTDPTQGRPEHREASERGIARLRECSNVELLGELPAHELPAWYKASDALLLVYDFETFASQVHNSHKLMGYLGSGTPIVATYTEWYDEKWLFPMAGEYEELESALRDTLADPDHYSGRQTRMQFALEHTYPKLVTQVAKILSGHA